MATDEPIKEIERVVIEPAEGDDDLVEAPEGAENEEDEAEEGDEDESPTGAKEQIVRRQPQKENEVPKTDDVKISEIEGETPREHALRLEVTRLKQLNRKERSNDILGKEGNSIPAKREMSPESKAKLANYREEEINALRDVFPVLAEEMGFVRSDQLNAQSYSEKAGSELDTFLDKHPEYLPENDKDNVLWSRFQEEYKLFKQPENPKDFKKLFERIHKDIFGIKVAGEGMGAINAAQRKVNSASHAGASAPTRASGLHKAPARVSSGLRTDMLRGFSDDEIAELIGE